jgi:hypothetical protein
MAEKDICSSTAYSHISARYEKECPPDWCSNIACRALNIGFERIPHF